MTTRSNKDQVYAGKGSIITTELARILIKEEVLSSYNVVLRRNKVISEVKHLHSAKGGLYKENIVHIVRKALDYLVKYNWIEQPYDRHYCRKIDDAKQIEENIKVTTKNNTYKSKIKLEGDERYFGIGRQSVYIYFYKNEQMHYIRNGRALWPCKIGMTTTSVEHRVAEQEKREDTHIDTIFRCENCSRLEDFIHEALKLCGKQFDTNTDLKLSVEQPHRGREWFITTPETVVQWWMLWEKTISEGE